MSEYLSMGGYAAFVWPCFLLTAIVLIWNLIAARRLHETARNRVLRRTTASKGHS